MMIGYIHTIVVIAFCQLSETNAATLEINLKCLLGKEIPGETNKVTPQILGCTAYRNRLWLKMIQMLPSCNDGLPSSQLPWHLWKNQFFHQKCIFYVGIFQSKRSRDCLCIFRTFLKKRKERTALMFVTKCCIVVKLKRIPCRIILVVDRNCSCSIKSLNRSDSIISLRNCRIMEKTKSVNVPNFFIDKPPHSSDGNINISPTNVRLKRAAVDNVIRSTINSSKVNQNETVINTTVVTQRTEGSREITTQAINTGSKITTNTNKSVVYQQTSIQNEIDAKWGILSIAVIVLMIMLSVQYNRLCQYRRRHQVYVDYLDRLKFVPVKDLVHSKAKYLPIFQFPKKKQKKTSFTTENSRRNLSLAVVEEESDDSDY